MARVRICARGWDQADQSRTSALSAAPAQNTAVLKVIPPAGRSARAALVVADAPSAVPLPVPAVLELAPEVALGAVGVVAGADEDAAVGVVESAPSVVAEPVSESVVMLSPPVIVDPMMGGLGGLVTDGAAVALVELDGPEGAEMRVIEKAGLVLPESPNTVWMMFDLILEMKESKATYGRSDSRPAA